MSPVRNTGRGKTFRKHARARSPPSSFVPFPHFLATFGDGKLGGKFALRSLLSAPEQILASEVAYDGADYAYRAIGTDIHLLIDYLKG